MIIFYSYEKQGDPECFRNYLPELQKDVDKRICMLQHTEWFDSYKDGKYYAMTATALNLCNLKGKIVLLPAIHGLVASMKEDNELQNCYLIAQPSDLISIEMVTQFKDYVIDFAYYDIFKKHVSDFIKKERPRDYWKWFKFDRGLY